MPAESEPTSFAVRTRMTENGNDFNDNGGCNGGDDTDVDDAQEGSEPTSFEVRLKMITIQLSQNSYKL